MGTDIHLYIETGKEGEWTPVEKPFVRDPEKDWSYKTWSDYWKEYDDKDYEVLVPDPTSRHYSVFALLADVRNGRGFAGVKTHEPVVPCFPNRGIPKDTTYRGGYMANTGTWIEKEESEGWIGDHSYTWATVAELRAVPWDTEYETYGTIHVSQYEHFKEHGQPEHWSGGIGGPGIVTWPTEAEYLNALDAGEIPEDEFDDDKSGVFSKGKHYLVVLWSWQPLEDCAFKQWLHYDWMKELIDEANGPENVRVTMGFDS